MASKNEKASRQPVTDCNRLGNAAKMYDKAWELITAFDNRVMSPKHIVALRKALAEAAGEEVRDEQAS